MAEQLLVVLPSQSNGGPFHDLETWLPDRVDLNLLVSSNKVSGSYNDSFPMPFNAPGYSTPRPLKGQAIRNIRYLQWYNPIVTGYTSYPGSGRVVNLFGSTFSHNAIAVWVEQQFLRPAKKTFTVAFGTSTSNINSTAHGLKIGDHVKVASTLGLPTGLDETRTYYVLTTASADVFTMSEIPLVPPAATFSSNGTGVHSVWVDAQVATVTRKTTGKQHTVSAILAPVMDVDAFTDAGDVITVLGHGGLEGDQLTLTGTLPTGLALATTYYLRYVDVHHFQLSLTPAGAISTFTGSGGAAQVHVVMAPLAGSRLLIDVLTPWVTPGPVFEEEFTFAIKTAAAVTNAASVKLGLNFGVRRATTASLKGLQIRQAATGFQRVIDTWDSATQTATVVNLVGLATQPWTLVGGEEVVIEPQGGIAWERYGFFLPWSMFESNLSESVLDKVNPYLPGFDYPGDFHAPAIYGTDQQVPLAIPGTAGLFKRTIYPWISWHVGFLARLSELYGREVWGLACDFGGTSASHTEPEIGTPNVGWYDKGQQTDWAPGRPNNCFHRLMDELDAAKEIAARQGDTLRVVMIGRNQGFADATSSSDPTYGNSVDQSRAAADKFYDTNKTFRRLVREKIKDLGMWPSAAAEIPFVQPLEQEESARLAIIGDAKLLKKVNDTIRRLTDEDDFADTWDQTGLLTGPDGIHFLGSELGKVEQSSMLAFSRILRRSDRSGELVVCSAALKNIGESGRVTSIRPSDGSHEADLCAEHFDSARDEVLEERNWGFATVRRRGSPRDTESPAWAYAYVRPSDCLRLIKVLPEDAVDDEVVTSRVHTSDINFTPALIGPAAQKHIEEVLSDGTAVFYSNEPNAVLMYVQRVTDTQRWPALFKSAMAARLSSKLVGATVKGADGAKGRLEWEEVSLRLMGRAAEIDAAQYENPPEHIPSWLAGME